MGWSIRAWAYAGVAGLAVAVVPVVGTHLPSASAKPIIAPVAAVAMVGPQSASASASASAKPTVAWHFAASSVTAGARPLLTYKVARPPRHGYVDVQRAHGRSWILLAHLRLSATGRGTYRARGVPLGKYTYRLVVRNSKGKSLSSTAHTLLSYGPVGLGAVMARSPRTASVGARRYSYVWAEAGWANKAELFLSRTSCRSISFTMAYTAPATAADKTATIATLTLSQRGTNKTANVKSGTVGTLSSSLTGKALQLELSNAPGNSYGNGTASCWTKNGRF